jgi:prepilin-type N-terminal cleavage/methylation domain-containing protein
MINFFKISKDRGFSLVETLVATAIFVTVSVGIYAGFVNILKIMNIIRTKEIMTNVANGYSKWNSSWCPSSKY